VNQDKGGNYGAFGLNYPVFEDAGEMVGTIPGVAGEHGVSADFVRHVIYRHKELIGPIRHMTDCHTMDLVRQDKERYGFKRLHKDIDVLTLKQMRIISNYIHSKKGIEFQLKLDEVNQAHWRLTSVPIEVFEQEHAIRVEAEERASRVEKEKNLLAEENATLTERVGRVEGELSDLRNELYDAAPYLKETASAAGRLLQAQKGTKSVRSIN